MSSPTLLFTIIGGAIGFASAVFAEPIRKRLLRPTLVVKFNHTEHFVTRSFQKAPAGRENAYFLRLVVENTSRYIARSCRAYLTNIEKESPYGKWEPTTYCENMQLRWVGMESSAFSGMDLLPGVPRLFEILSTRESVNVFQLSLEQVLNRYSKITNDRGKFRFSILVAGDGVKPALHNIVFEWDGGWETFRVEDLPVPTQSDFK